MERVSIREGNEPILILGPHGYDDDNTNVIAECLAENLDAYAVINNGWERGPFVDFWNDKANCNDIGHLHKDVVKEEFLDPILDFVFKIRKKQFQTIYTFIIHGFSLPKKPVDIILGFGNGKPPRYSCDPWRKTALGYFLSQKGFETYEGGIGSNYAGWGHNNLNQLFGQIWYPDDYIHSIQIEIARQWRATAADARAFTPELTTCIESLLDCGDVEPKASSSFRLSSFG